MDLQTASADILNKVHAYMREHPESELHRQGKMFGVLLCEHSEFSIQNSDNYLAAFSAKLDGSYYHEGFVPPVFEMTAPPIGTSKAESQRLQKLLFAQYNLLNSKGESKNILEIFANEPPILSPEEWFNKSVTSSQNSGFRLPPAGAGECCAPKLLQYAFKNGLKPIALAEFWIGAPSKTEIRREGQFYAPCSGRCVPILRHMMQGLEGLKIEGVNKPTAVTDRTDVPIIYEDEWLIVVNKPSGLLSIPGKTEEASVTRILTKHCGYPVMPVHRLDQDTSGLLVLAKNAEIYRILQAYFQRRDILKVYTSWLRPSVDRRLTVGETGTIDLPLLPNPYDRPRQMVDKEHGKVAITRYVIKEVLADGSFLVDFYPLTGRTHQLRVHAAHPEGLNAPIIGDRLYGNDTNILEEEASNRLKFSGTSNRLMLHAAEIAFVHPVTKEEMHFCIPSDFSH